MKAYVAARFDKKQEVLGLHQLLKQRGYEIAADWTTHKSIKPYEQYKQLAGEYAVEESAATMNCDVFIILSSDAGTGMYVELGAAIASCLLRDRPKIYVVGENNICSMFYFHPMVQRCDTAGEVLEKLNYG